MCLNRIGYISRGNTKQQELVVETYLKLLTTALEDDYFICDYNMKYNVASQNEIVESCSQLYPFLFNNFRLSHNYLCMLFFLTTSIGTPLERNL